MKLSFANTRSIQYLPWRFGLPNETQLNGNNSIGTNRFGRQVWWILVALRSSPKRGNKPTEVPLNLLSFRNFQTINLRNQRKKKQPPSSRSFRTKTHMRRKLKLTTQDWLRTKRTISFLVKAWQMRSLSDGGTKPQWDTLVVRPMQCNGGFRFVSLHLRIQMGCVVCVRSARMSYESNLNWFHRWAI